MAENSPTVIIIDDDSSVRESLSLLLSSAGYRVKTFVSAMAFLDSQRPKTGPACLVLDIKMPGINGFDLQEELIAMDYAIPIVFITGHGDIPMSVRAMKKGAVDFLAKPFDDDQLLIAVKEALQKDSKARSDRDEKMHILGRIASLTARESQILTYLITGMLNKQIGHELKISERTVKAHRKQVLHKMRVNSIAELVRLAMKAGVEPADISS